MEATKLGPYQRGAVSVIKEFRGFNVLVSGCSSGNIAFWDIIKRDVLTSFTALGNITSGDLSQNDQILIVGSSLGVIRVYNIANIRKPVLQRVIKLFKNKPINNITINPNQTLIAVSSIESPKVYFLALSTLTIVGYVELPVTVNAIAWNTSSK